MAKEYTKEQIWELYRKLPAELQDALFSVENAEKICDICERYHIGEKTYQVATLVGDVLLGILSPEEFPHTLKEELKLEEKVVKQVVQEINRFIFFPVKESLATLYKIEITPPAKPGVIPGKEKPAGPKKPDIYREPIE